MAPIKSRLLSNGKEMMKKVWAGGKKTRHHTPPPIPPQEFATQTEDNATDSN